MESTVISLKTAGMVVKLNVGIVGERDTRQNTVLSRDMAINVKPNPLLLCILTNFQLFLIYVLNAIHSFVYVKIVMILHVILIRKEISTAKEKIAIELIQLNLVQVQTVIRMSVKINQYRVKQDKAILYYLTMKRIMVMTLMCVLLSL